MMNADIDHAAVTAVPPIAPGSLIMAAVPPCPLCGYDLAATFAAGQRRCPECGWTFTEADLQLLGPSNLRGQPRSLAPGDRRISGPMLLAALAALSIAAIAFTLVIAALDK
jgi:hypothetical protein